MRTDDTGPFSLETLAAIDVPALFTTDMEELKARYVAWYEAAADRKIYPMQVEMLLIEMLAYAMSVLGEEGQMVIHQHLVTKASETGLVALGANRSTPRLPAAKALAELRFTIEEEQPVPVVIAAGTRVSAEGSSIDFATKTDATIPAGETSVDVSAEAITAGASGNGFSAGSVTSLLDPVAGVSVTNITASEGGADIEALELYRLRVANAFERISTGGSRAWYRETAMGVSSSIIDCAVIRPSPCHVELYPLTQDGAAGASLREALAAYFDSEDIKDIRFGDDVAVLAAPHDTLTPVLTVRVSALTATLQTEIKAAANAVMDAWCQKLGPTIAPSDVEKAVKASSTLVIDAELSAPAFQQLDENRYLRLNDWTPTLIKVRAS